MWTSYEQHFLPINVFEALHGYGQGNILHSEVSYLVPINGYWKFKNVVIVVTIYEFKRGAKRYV